ncbi:hypothetical protein [uncultured Clostridium sp.]|uniref:hypothetical protein n=1 Tax=uncultured Clostridium sp. TaxID=59620 RepID=UPI0028EBF007|nr:hypothetical protein [uncultured Clostridium sp.]
MRYFALKQDGNLINSIEFEDFNNSQKTTLLKRDEKTFKESTSIFIKGNKDSIYPDYFQAPVLMVSDELHKIFRMHENTIIYKIVVFSNLKLQTQKVYRLVLPDIIDGLSDKTTYLKNGWIDKLILDAKKIGEYNIFQVKAGVDYYFIVSLDVLESMLKRGKFVGIRFIEIGVE